MRTYQFFAQKVESYSLIKDARSAAAHIRRRALREYEHSGRQSELLAMDDAAAPEDLVGKIDAWITAHPLGVYGSSTQELIRFWFGTDAERQEIKRAAARVPLDYDDLRADLGIID